MSKPIPASSKLPKLGLVLPVASGTFALTTGYNFKDVRHIVKE